MIFRFCSGSVTPASRSRNSADASTNTSGSFSRSKRLRICAASSRRSTPLSTKMHVSASPTARWMMSAATVESTPPLSAQTTRPPPTCARIFAGRLLDERRHRPVAGAAADAVREVAQNLEAALGVHDLRVKEQRVEAAGRGSAIAATGAFALVATTEKPAGAAATKSPWLAQTRISGGTSANSAAALPCPVTRTTAWPNSRCGAGATRPPSECAINCMP